MPGALSAARKGGTFLAEGVVVETGKVREGTGRPEYIVTSPIVFEVGAKGSGLYVVVPAGYITDLYSMPGKLLQLFQPRHADYMLASILHDWLYDTGLVPRDMCDRILLQAMREVGAEPWHRFLVYRAVRFGGRGGYGRPLACNLGIVTAFRDYAVSEALLIHLKERANV